MPLSDTNSTFPRIKLRDLVETRELMHYINRRSGFVSSDVIGMMYEFRDVILDFMRDARPVKLEGLGIFSPSIKLDGTINIKFRPDKSFVAELNQSNNLKDYITNRKNLGKTLSDLEQLETE